MEGCTLGIYVPSYRRSNKILTYHLLEYCTYMVRKSEEQAYREAGVENIWAVDDELINRGDKAYFYIAEHAPEDIIVVADDDIEDFQYLLVQSEQLGCDKETITSEIERIGQILFDLNLGLAFIPPNCIPCNYSQEFAFKGIPGAVKWFNRNVFKAKLDEKVSHNFDIDMVLQELLVNRICLMPKYFYDKGFVDVNEGGNSNRLRAEQLASITTMQAKWGKYFGYVDNKNKPRINVKR